MNKFFMATVVVGLMQFSGSFAKADLLAQEEIGAATGAMGIEVDVQGNEIDSAVGFDGRITCVAHSSRGPAYDAVGYGNSDIEAHQDALRVCGPNCNGRKGSETSYDCTRTGGHGGGGGEGKPGQGGNSRAVMCVSYSSRGNSYNAIGYGRNDIEAHADALRVCGPNCDGHKGNEVGYDCRRNR